MLITSDTNSNLTTGNCSSSIASNMNSGNHNTFDQDYTSHHTSAMAPGHLASHHLFTSHYSHQAPSSIYNSQSASRFSSLPFDQNQFSSLNHYPNHHGLHSSFSPSPFHLNLPKSNFEHTISNSIGGGQTLMPNDSCNSSGSSGSSSNSPISSSSSSPDSKFNFLRNPQSSYLNYLNKNSAFPSQNNVPSAIQLQSNTTSSSMHPSMQHAYSTFGDQTSKPFSSQLNSNSLSNTNSNQFNSALCLYDEDELRGEDEEDDISMSHLDLKAMMHYSSGGSEPLPGKTRTREKYRSVYSEQQRHELENEFEVNKYISIKRKTELAQRLLLSERQIKIWFQNRRAKMRRQDKGVICEKKPFDPQQPPQQQPFDQYYQF